MKAKTIFYCTQCGNEFPKWQGQCPACGAWNTIVEQPAPAKGKGIVKPARAPGATHVPKRVSEMTFDQEIRFPTGLAELDRVLGGGAVQGSLVLIGGAPGIGKSTLMLQICQQLCQFAKVLYVSGEESERQLKLRADRLGVGQMDLYLFAESSLEQIIAAIEEQTQQKFQDDCLVAKVEKLESAVKDLTDDDGENRFTIDELAVILDMNVDEIRDILRLTGDDK